MHEYFELLLHIAEKKGVFGRLESSTAEIASSLKVSQQTISRKLRDMEIKGLIKRQVNPDGIIISIDDKGRDFLKQNLAKLKNIFSSRDNISGKVTAGIGEGSYYVSLPNYQKEFVKQLGFKAYPGTLNLSINRDEVSEFLAGKKEITIPGFTTKSRTFGSLKCYRIKINNINGAIVVPERARHSEDIIEIIAQVNLRQKLKVEDKDKVTITI